MRLVSWLSSGGIGPVSLLSDRKRNMRLVSWLSSGGIGPVS